MNGQASQRWARALRCGLMLLAAVASAHAQGEVPTPPAATEPAPTPEGPAAAEGPPETPEPGSVPPQAPSGSAPGQYQQPYPGQYQQPYPGQYQQPYPGQYQQPYPGQQQPYPGQYQQPYPGQQQPFQQPPFEPPPPDQPWPEASEATYRHHRLTLQTEAVFSADEGPFYNHLLGGRYDYHTSQATSFGAYVGYANLKGTHGRVHSALLMGQVEYHFFFGSEQRLIVPLRAGIGYLVKNGGMVRFASGLYYRVRDDLELGFDLIAPTFWTASNDTVVSMSLAAEASYAF